MIIKKVLTIAAIVFAAFIAIGIVGNMLMTPEQKAANEKAHQERAAQETAAAAQAAVKKDADEAAAKAAAVAERKKKIADAWDAGTLLSFYQRNEVKADQTLKGYRIPVKGVVDKIGKDILNTPYVTLKTDDMISSVQVMFSDSDEASLVNLQPGQRVVLEGKVTGKMMNVILRDGAVIQ